MGKKKKSSHKKEHWKVEKSSKAREKLVRSFKSPGKK
jgi:hypothetical protein